MIHSCGERDANHTTTHSQTTINMEAKRTKRIEVRRALYMAANRSRQGVRRHPGKRFSVSYTTMKQVNCQRDGWTPRGMIDLISD